MILEVLTAVILKIAISWDVGRSVLVFWRNMFSVSSEVTLQMDAVCSSVMLLSSSTLYDIMMQQTMISYFQFQNVTMSF